MGDSLNRWLLYVLRLVLEPRANSTCVQGFHLIVNLAMEFSDNSRTDLFEWPVRVIFLIPIPGDEMGIYMCTVRGSLGTASHFGVKRGGAVGPQLLRVFFEVTVFSTSLHSPSNRKLCDRLAPRNPPDQMSEFSDSKWVNSFENDATELIARSGRCGLLPSGIYRTSEGSIHNDESPTEITDQNPISAVQVAPYHERYPVGFRNVFGVGFNGRVGNRNGTPILEFQRTWRRGIGRVSWEGFGTMLGTLRSR